MKSALLAAAAALLVSHTADAAPWSVDYGKSRLGFSVLWSNEPFSATFKKWNAVIDFNPSDLPHAHAGVTIDLASAESDEADFDSGLKGPEGFDTSRFATAHFETTRISQKSGNSYVAEGTLELHGISRKVAVPFTLAISGKTAHMTGTARVLRTDFNLGHGIWAAPDPVAHEVSINIDLVATQP